MKGIKTVTAVVILLIGAGCGTVITTDYPNRLIGAAGQAVVWDDVQEIVDHPNLDDEEKRQRLRDLGIEDEKLIEALLTA